MPIVRLATNLIIIAVIVAAHASVPAPRSWIVVASELGGPTSPSIVVDASGVPHFLWLDWRSGNMITASLDRTSGSLVNQQAIDDAGGVATLPSSQLAMAGSRIYAAWIDCCGPSGGGGVLAVSFSDDGGATFSRNLFAPATDAHDVDAATDQVGNLYLVWRDGPAWESGAIILSVFYPNSTSFRSAVVVRASDGYAPAVAVDGPYVYVAWAAADGSLHVARSADTGQSFGPSVVVQGPGALVMEPDLAVHRGAVHLAWAGYAEGGWRPLVSRSIDGAQSFLNPTDLEGSAGQRDTVNPNFAIGEDGYLYVTWVSHRTYLEAGLSIRTARSPGNATGWHAVPIEALPEARADFLSPDLAVDRAGHWFLAYDRETVSQSVLAYELRLSTDLTFGPLADPSVFPLAAAFAAAFLGPLSLAAVMVLRERRRRRMQSVSGPPTGRA